MGALNPIAPKEDIQGPHGTCPHALWHTWQSHASFADGVFYSVQEAQLSQRDCATLRVTEYFAKSPKVTQGHSQ